MSLRFYIDHLIWLQRELNTFIALTICRAISFRTCAHVTLWWNIVWSSSMNNLRPPIAVMYFLSSRAMIYEKMPTSTWSTRIGMILDCILVSRLFTLRSGTGSRVWCVSSRQEASEDSFFHNGPIDTIMNHWSQWKFNESEATIIKESVQDSVKVVRYSIVWNRR